MTSSDQQASTPDVDQLARSMLLLHGAHGEDHPHDGGFGDRSRPKTSAFLSDPNRVAALHEATERDRERYLTYGLQPVDCRHCHASVSVRKLGPEHTSVQWNSDASNRCAYFTEIREAGRLTARSRACPRLADSIDHAIAEGILEPESTAPRPGDG